MRSGWWIGVDMEGSVAAFVERVSKWKERGGDRRSRRDFLDEGMN